MRGERALANIGATNQEKIHNAATALHRHIRAPATIAQRAALPGVCGVMLSLMCGIMLSVMCARERSTNKSKHQIH